MSERVNSCVGAAVVAGWLLPIVAVLFVRWLRLLVLLSSSLLLWWWWSWCCCVFMVVVPGGDGRGDDDLTMAQLRASIKLSALTPQVPVSYLASAEGTASGQVRTVAGFALDAAAGVSLFTPELSASPGL